MFFRLCYLFELGQTLGTAEFDAAALRLEHDWFVAAGVTVLTDWQFVDVAEAEKAGLAADLVDDVLLYDLMFALQDVDKQQNVKHT